MTRVTSTFTRSAIDIELLLQVRTHRRAFMHREVTDMLCFNGSAEGIMYLQAHPAG